MERQYDRYALQSKPPNIARRRRSGSKRSRVVDPTNNESTFVSYYPYGAIVALALDLTLRHFKIHDTDDWERAIKRHEPGDKVKITYRPRDVEKTMDITFANDPALEIVLFENTDTEPSDTQIAFRKAWIGPDNDAPENE